MDRFNSHVIIERDNQYTVLTKDPINLIAFGDGYTSLVSKNRFVYSFGKNDYGQLGARNDIKYRKSLILSYETKIDIVKIVCGLRHTLILTYDGNIITWGDSTLGQCGFGQSELVCYPKRLNNYSKSNSDQIYIDISVGPNYSLALTNTKIILFWGSYGKNCSYVPELLFKTDESHTSPYALVSFDSFVQSLSTIACPKCYENKNINLQKLKILGNNESLCCFCNKTIDKTSDLTNKTNNNNISILDCSNLCFTKCICHLTQLRVWEINQKSNKFEANITLQSLYLNDSFLYMGMINNLSIGLGMYGLLYIWQFEKDAKKPIVFKFLDYHVWDLCLTKEKIWLSTIDCSKMSNICLLSIDSNTLIDHIINNKADVNAVLPLQFSNIPTAQYHNEFGIPCAYVYQNNKLGIITHTVVEEKEKCKTNTLSYKLWDEHIHTFVELEILALTLNSFQTHCFHTTSLAFKDDIEDKGKTFQKFGQNSPDVSLLFTLLCQKLALLLDSNTKIALLFRDVINSQPNIHEFVQIFIESSTLNELYNITRDVIEHLCNFVVSTYNINPELNMMEKFTEGLPQLIRSYVGIEEFDKTEPLNVFTSVTLGIVSKAISVILNFINHLNEAFEMEPLFFEISEGQKTVKDVNRKILKESKESWEKIRSHLQNEHESASNTCIFWKGASFCLQENLYHPSRRFIIGSKSDSAAQGEGLNMGSLTGSVSSLYNFLRGGRSSGSSPPISCLAGAEEDRQPTTSRSESRNSPSRNLKIYSPSAASKLMGNYLFNPVYYLFNDKFVSFHPPTTIKSYDLLTLWLQPLEEGSLNFTLKTPEEFIKVTATSQEAKSIWVRAINRATRNLILRQSSVPAVSPRIEWATAKAFPSRWRQFLASLPATTLSYPSELGDQGQGSHAPEIRHAGYTFTKDKVVFYVDVTNGTLNSPIPDQLFVTNLEGATYRGAWLNGMMHGRGRLVFKDSKKYGGQFKQNAFNGLGTLKIPSHSSSSSQNSPSTSPIGQQAGTTNRDWWDGMNQYDCVQEGWWVDGKLNGYGSVRYKNGETYQGYFREGAKNGFGKWRQGNSSANGPPCNTSFYIGQWSNDQRKGYGIMDNLNEGEKYIGMWDGDQYNGPGIVAIIDGLYYEGQFKQGKLEGKGFMAMENGTLFEGEIVGPGNFGGSGRLIVPKSADSVLRITGRFGGSWTSGITMNEATLLSCEPGLVGDGSHEFPILENYYVHHHNNSLGARPCSDGENFGNFKGFDDGEANTSPNIISSHYYMDQGELQGLIRERDVCWNFVFEPTLLELGLSPSHFNIHLDTLLAQPDVLILSEMALNRCEKCWQHMTTSIDQRKRYDKEFNKKKEGILPSELELIPDAMKQATLSLSEYYWIVSYVNKALDASSLHPFGALMDRIVEVFRASYVGIGAHPRLLSRAVSDVHIITTKFYTFLRALFPNLPATGVVIKADNSNQVETSFQSEDLSPDLMATPTTTPTVDNSYESFRSFSKLKRGLKSRNLSSSTISLPMTLLRNINLVRKADSDQIFSTKSTSHASLEEEREQKFGAVTHGHQGTERHYGTKGAKIVFPRHYCVPEEGGGNQLISDTGNDPSTSGHVTIASAYVSEHALLQPLLLPRIYPALFTLYALHFQAEDRDYYRKVTRMNKFKETFLLELLGVPKKFWAPLDVSMTIKEEKSPSTNITETEGAPRPKHLYYENAIETLQQISTAFSPLEKLQVIGDTYDSINKEVESRHEGEMNRHVWSMDDLFPLFLYVVVKARLSRLGSETHYVQDLMEPKLQYGKLGLLFTTLKACYYQIQTEKNRV